MAKALPSVYLARRTFKGCLGVCPHCGAFSTFDEAGFSKIEPESRVPGDVRPIIGMQAGRCPGCWGLVVGAILFADRTNGVNDAVYLWPPTMPPDKCPKSVPNSIRKTYDEARRVFHASPSACAVLVRRALQQLIRDKLKITKDTLYKEISEAVKSDYLSKPAREGLHHIRDIGNWGAHPERAKVPAGTTIDDASLWVDVSHEEAEYCIAALEIALHDLYDAPERLAAMQTKINARKQAR